MNFSLHSLAPNRISARYQLYQSAPMNRRMAYYTERDQILLGVFT